MKWTDVFDIAMALTDQYPETDPQYVNFVDLHRWVCDLEEFDDDPDRSGMIPDSSGMIPTVAG